MDAFKFISDISNNVKGSPYNENYNSTDKRNNIITPSVLSQRNAAVELARKDAATSYNISQKESDKYAKYGINYNTWENLNDELAHRQSNLSKTVNALGQTVVNELGLGTVLAASDLVDGTINAVLNTFTEGENDYHNPVSDYLREKQEEFKEYAPVYVDSQSSHIGDQFTNPSWGYFMSNLPDIASTVTLMVPGMGVVKGLSWLSKVSRLNKGIRAASRASKVLKEKGNLDKLNWLQKAMIDRGVQRQVNTLAKVGTEAGVMRFAENYQEAIQASEESYNQNMDYLNRLEAEGKYSEWAENNPYLKNLTDDEGNPVDVNDKNEVAKAIARNAAKRTFKIDMLNIVSDCLQVYGLRNMSSLISRMPRNTNKVLRANEASINNIGKSANEVAKEAAQRSWLRKAKDVVTNNTKAAWHATYAEASEGIEEAVNYVAQEEGINYGNVLLGTASDSDFDDRFKKYLKAPELWDSAFWGVMGGVTFGAVHGAVNAIDRKIEHARKRKGDDTTKENLAWYDFGMDDDTKNSIDIINKRTERTQQYADRMAKIKGTYNEETGTYSKGINPDTDETLTEEEAEILAAREEDKYLTDIYLGAARDGNLGLLKDFIGSKQVAEYFKSQGIGNATDAEIQQRLERLDKIDKMYKDEIRRVDLLSDAFDTKDLFAHDVHDKESENIIKNMFKDNGVPLEYIQLIAEQNVRAKLDKERHEELYNDQLSQAERELAEMPDSKLDNTIDYKNVIRTHTLIEQLNYLQSEKDKILESENKDNSFSAQISLDNINKKEKLIKNLLYNTNNQSDDNLANLIFALSHSKSYKINEENTKEKFVAPTRNAKGYFQSFDTFLDELGAVQSADGNYTNFENLDKFIVNNGGKLLDENGNKKEIDSQTIAQKVNLLRAADEAIYDNKENRKILSLNFASAFANATQLEYMMAMDEGDMVMTVDEVAREIGEYNNTMAEARGHAINKAVGILTNLYDKYNNNDETKASDIESLLYGDDNKWFTSSLSDEDKTDYYDAMKVLNLSSKSNAYLKKQVVDMINRQVLINERIKAGLNNQPTSDKELKTTQNSSTSGKQVAGQEKTKPNNQSQPKAKPNTTQANTQIGNVGTGKRSTLSISINNEGNPIIDEDNGAKLPVNQNEDGSYELQLPDDGTHVKELTNDKLYDIQKSLVDGGTVIKNPIVDIDDDGNLEVIERGIIGKKEPNAQPIQSGAPTAASTTATQGEASTDEELPPVAMKGADGKLTTLSSTGEPTETDAAHGYNPPLADATTKAKTIIYKAVDSDTDLDEVGNSVVEELMSDGLTREDAKSIVDEMIPGAKRMKAFMAKSPKTAKAVSNIQVANALFIDNPTEDNLVNFEKAFKDVIEQYAKDLKLNKIHGRYYVVSQDLLRYCNDICDNESIADALHQGVVKLLESNGNATIDYVVIDQSELTKEGFLKKTITPIEEVISTEALQHDHRVDVLSILSELNQEDREGIYKELEKLKVGDKLYYEVNDEDDHVIIYAGRNKKTRKAIGQLPLPARDNGRFVWINRGWNVDVALDENNKPVSELKNFFIDLFAPNPNDKEAIYFNNLLMEYTFGLPNDKVAKAKRSGEILKEFEKIYQTPRFAKYIADSDKATTPNLTRLLRNVYGPMVTATNTAYSTDIRRRLVTTSLNNWFNKLYESYEFANSLTKGRKSSIIVSQIHKGRPRFTSGTDKNIASKALTKENAKVAKIAVGTKNSRIRLSTGEDISIGGRYGSTYVILPNGNDKVKINAWPINVNDSKSTKAKAIKKAVEQEIDRVVDAYAKDFNYDELHKFIDNLFSVGYSGNGMFISAKDDDNKKKVYAVDLKNNTGLKIYYGNKSITIYRNYFGTQKASNKVDFHDGSIAAKASGVKTNAKLKEALKEMLNDLNYNINFNYITNSEFNNGFMSKNAKGEITIKIGNAKAIKFKSLEDMFINNDLVELSIETNDNGTSNFYRLGEEIEDCVKNNKAGQFLRIQLANTVSSTSNDKASEPKVKVADESYTTHKAAIDNIIKSEKTDNSEDGVAIVSEIAPELADKLSAIEYNDGTISLLPNKIVLDNDMKESASFTYSTGITRIGKRTYNNLNSPKKNVRYAGIKTMIHEKIHDILHRDNNKKYIGQVREVYNEAKDAIDKLLKDNNLANPFTHDANGEITDAGLEEFIAYSLTDSKFAKLLNSIDAEGNEVNKENMSILQRIMDIVSKIFGWGIRDNSLYAKEFNALRDMLEDSNEEETTISDEEETVDNTEDDDLEITIEDNSENQNSDETKENLTEDDDDDFELFSIFDDISIEPTTGINITSVNLATAANKIPLEDRNKFIDSVSKGEITQKCN